MPPKLLSTPTGIVWTSPNQQTHYEDAVVQKIHFICHPPHEVDDPPTKYTNHWIFSLETTSLQSVQVNLGSAPITNKLRLEVTPKPYIVDTDVLFYVTLVPVQSLTVKEVLDLIKLNGLDKYTLDSDGNGCRFWILQFLTHLNETGKVSNSQATADLVDRIGKTWHADATGEITELSPPRGTPVSPGIFD
ncbi:hypothetical protein DV738_g2901, partial [Chaetothyriales sp. CBS 135597]